MPSIEAMLITLAGRSALAALRSGPASACVRKNGVFRFRSTTLSQPFSGKLSKILAPGGAGVVDEDVERRLVLGVRRDQRLHALRIGNVGRQRHAGAEGRQLTRRGVARLGLARGDVNGARARLQEAGGDHAADAARAAGDEGSAA